MSQQDEIDFEQLADQVRAENAALLEGFGTWLTDSGLKEKTTRKHQGNVSFYIDHDLLWDDITRPKDGLSRIDGFFNWFFLRKAMWSSVASTKETAASLKKLYRYLVEIGNVEVEDDEEFLAEVKNEMPDWLEHYRDFDGW